MCFCWQRGLVREWRGRADNHACRWPVAGCYAACARGSASKSRHWSRVRFGRDEFHLLEDMNHAWGGVTRDALKLLKFGCIKAISLDVVIEIPQQVFQLVSVL